MTDVYFCIDAACMVLRTGVTSDCTSTLSGVLVSAFCPGKSVSSTGGVGGGGGGGGGHGFFRSGGGGHGFCTIKASSTMGRSTPEVL